MVDQPVTRRTAIRLIGATGVAIAAPTLWGAGRSMACEGRPANTRFSPTGSGSTTRALAPQLVSGVSPDTVGEWSAPIPGPRPIVGVHATLLHTGKVLLVDKSGAYVWDPLGSGHVSVNPPNILYCSGHTVLANGNVLFVGGVDQNGARGPRWTYEFDVANSGWVRGPDTRRGRYYPTVCLLADGRTVITSGKLEDGKTLNDDVEVYHNRTLQLVGSRLLRMYPHMSLLPSGKVLVSDAAARTAVLDPGNWSWATAPNMLAKRVSSAGVLMPSGPNGTSRVLVTGGHKNNTAGPVATTESFDAANPAAGWRAQAPLPQPRSHMNLVYLPDGSMLGVGGTNADGKQAQSLLYDPTANTWTGLVSQTEERGYHSTALLLPDGRVLSAGDNFAPGGGSKLELYSPPYLFRGARPVITGAPSTATWAATINIATPSTVSRVVLVRPGSVTHTNDMNQRHIELDFTTTGDGVTAGTPVSANVAPPGWYMLFLLDPVGVPSIAHWVQFAS